MALDHSEGFEFWSRNCVRFPVFRVLSTDYVNGLDFWSMPIVDDAGTAYPFIWEDVRGQLISMVIGGDRQLTNAIERFRLHEFLEQGYVGTVQLPGGSVINVDIQPVERNYCDIMSVEIIKSCSGFSGVDNEEAFVTFSNHDNDFEDFTNGQPVAKEDCKGDSIDYKNTESNNAGKSFIIDVGFRWGCDSDYREYVNKFKGSTHTRALRAMQNGGLSLTKFRLLNNLQAFADIPYPTTQTDTLVGHLTTLFNYIDVDFDIRTAYNPTFTIDQDERVSVFTTLNQLAQLSMGRVYWDGEKVIYESLEWWERNRLTPVATLDTCDDVISVNPPIINEDYSAVKVQQFTNDGGVEQGRGSADGQFLTITNPYLSTDAMAGYLADRLVANIAQGAQTRVVETVGLPWIDIGDVVSLRERVDSYNEAGECKSVFSESSWRVCRVAELYNGSGITQKLTLDKIGVQPFISITDKKSNTNTTEVCGTISDPNSSVQVTFDLFGGGTNGANSTAATVNPDGTWCVTVTLPDGMYLITATATSPIGRQSTTFGTLMIDTTPPGVPSLGTTCYNDPQNFGGLVNSNQSPTQTIVITVGGQTINATISPDGLTWAASASLPQGSYTLDITATNSIGTSATTSHNITVDTSPPPTPTLDNLGGIANNPITLTGTAEPGSTLNLIVNGQMTAIYISVDATGAFSETIVLPVGDTTLSLIAEDCAGNVSFASLPQFVKILGGI